MGIVWQRTEDSCAIGVKLPSYHTGGSAPVYSGRLHSSPVVSTGHDPMSGSQDLQVR